MAMGPVWTRSALGPIVAIVAVTSGCRWMPVRQSNPPAYEAKDVGSPAIPATPERTTPPAFPDLPPLTQIPKLQPISDEEALPADSKTDILATAAIRDDEIKKAVAESVPNLLTPPRSEKPVETPANVQATEGAETGENATPGVAASTHRTEPQVPELRPDPSQAWRIEVEHLLELCGTNARNGGDPGEVWATRERVLTCLAEPKESSLWKTVVSALAIPAAADDPAENPESAKLPAPQADVIADLQLCRRIMGFGKTEPFGADQLKPGQEVLLYTESEGLGIEPARDGFRSRLSSSVAILSPADGHVHWSRDFEVEDWCRRRRRDFFVGYSFAIPPDLAPGNYVVRLIQKDLVAGREATKVVRVTVLP